MIILYLNTLFLTDFLSSHVNETWPMELHT